ncbi:hypothetical protein RFI_00589 [Reticulomyxa filosa]|uniref:SWIM-type domain-containing protein n=1 Tax=Reticulomyxa filosa TaxID=46433 RepID=X6PEE5_RETFI|nr:hypothetical protein RFI_00589 [Reticulomyxa filosa]|eukprot:ETO36473.1 hypothetical protein RFI_00589 [Reticulomyxa filosa]
MKRAKLQKIKKTESEVHNNDKIPESEPKQRRKRKRAEISATDVPSESVTKSPPRRRRKITFHSKIKQRGQPEEPEKIGEETENKASPDKNADKSTESTDDKDKKEKEEKKEEKQPEKRLHRWRTSCPQSTKERIERFKKVIFSLDIQLYTPSLCCFISPFRAQTQRLFMISATEVSDTRRQYAVLGSTGNVYTVEISHVNTCNCPDSVRGNLCKHVLFVLLKVLKIKSDSPYLYQRSLVTSELQKIFSEAPKISIGVLANEAVRKKYHEKMGGEMITDKEADPDSNKGVARKACDGGDCPVCMDELDESKEELVWCKAQCGQNLHKECFTIWAKQSENRGESVTCVYCRAEWVGDSVNQPKKKKGLQPKQKIFFPIFFNSLLFQKNIGSGIGATYLNLAE